MQTFVVRPVIAGLLGLIAAGLWSGPFSARDGHGQSYQSDCRAGSAASQAPAMLGVMIRRGARC
jgi:hypothetical protein